MNARSELVIAGLVISCEHASARLPAIWRSRLAIGQTTLATHAAFDTGALDLARRLAFRFDAPLIEGRVTRLLVDLNRPEHAAFGRYSRSFERADREALLDSIHRPHWNRLRAAIDAQSAGTVLHLGCHSFTPRLRGRRRSMDLGLLYDPSRSAEREFVASWRLQLAEAMPWLRIRRNAPYRGNSSGLTSSLRAELPPERYLGIEIELNQALRRGERWQALLRGIAASLRGFL